MVVKEQLTNTWYVKITRTKYDIDTEMVSEDIKLLVFHKLTLETNIAL